MPGSKARRTALIVWAAFAFVTWNVVFDRQVYLAGVQFTTEQIQRQQRGEPVVSIDAGFEPALAGAAWRASLWSGGVLIVGLLLNHREIREIRRGYREIKRSARKNDTSLNSLISL